MRFTLCESGAQLWILRFIDCSSTLWTKRQLGFWSVYACCLHSKCTRLRPWIRFHALPLLSFFPVFLLPVLLLPLLSLSPFCPLSLFIPFLPFFLAFHMFSFHFESFPYKILVAVVRCELFSLTILYFFHAFIGLNDAICWVHSGNTLHCSLL